MKKLGSNELPIMIKFVRLNLDLYLLLNTNCIPKYTTPNRFRLYDI